jgi:hypothetical protein
MRRPDHMSGKSTRAVPSIHQRSLATIASDTGVGATSAVRPRMPRTLKMFEPTTFATATSV